MLISVGDIGTPTRMRKQLDLPVSVLMQPKSQDNSEVDSKMKEIMKMNGILNINGKVDIRFLLVLFTEAHLEFIMVFISRNIILILKISNI